MDELIQVARGVSANTERQVLILLMLWPRFQPSETAKLNIQTLLPTEHPSLAWISSGPIHAADDSLISDIGEPAICKLILNVLNPEDD